MKLTELGKRHDVLSTRVPQREGEKKTHEQFPPLVGIEETLNWLSACSLGALGEVDVANFINNNKIIIIFV